MNEITEKSIRELIEGIKNKSFSVREVVLAFYNVLKKQETELKSFIHYLEQDLIEKNLQELEKKATRGDKILFGIPFSLKDSYCTAGIATTAGSKVLEGYKPQYNATVYQKLLDNGALLFGKNSQDAWGHGSTSENTDFKIARNPWNLEKVVGGSSGGCAAAIASRMVAFAIGEDTGGSIRNPASYCNITGLKVTYGRVSRYGTIAYGSSLDTVGPMAKSVEDIAQILSVIAGYDPFDATSSPEDVPDYTGNLKKGIKNITLGVPKEFFQSGTDKEVVKTVRDAILVFENLGAKVIEVSIPSIDIGVAAYYLLAPSETSSNLARYDGIRYGQARDKFTLETMRRILIGTYALSAGYYDAYYKKSLKARTIIKKDYQNAFEKCDLLIAPVNPTPAPKIGEMASDPIALMLSDIYTLTQNIAGIPALALPCGFTSGGLPIGMQLMGDMFKEENILQAGFAYQELTDWHKRKPNL